MQMKGTGSKPGALACVGLAMALLLGTELIWAKAPEIPILREERMISGWTVLVDERLLGESEVGRRALKLLETKLDDIASVVEGSRLEGLRRVAIVLDLQHPQLKLMQYNSNLDWLLRRGYGEELHKKVLIPSAAQFIDARQNNEQPWLILHELAHGYHDQVLGFDHPGVEAAFKAFKAGGRGEAALSIYGGRARHYALSDRMEFFSEMTEAYFGINDYYPFNRVELKEAEPAIFALLAEIWGESGKAGSW